MITKLITNQSFDFDGPSSSLVPIHSRGVESNWLVKQAGHGLFHKFLQDFQPPKNMTVIHTLAVGDEEFYGCLAAGTRVLMADGSSKPIDQLELGEFVQSGEGEAREVISLYRREVPQALKVSVEGSPFPVNMSLNHPVQAVAHEQVRCVRDTYKKCSPPLRASGGNICNRGKGCEFLGLLMQLAPERRTAEELRPGDYLIYNIGLEQAQPPRNFSTEECRLLGYWLAEGCFQRSSRTRKPRHLRLSFGYHERDSLVRDVEQLADSLGYTASVYDQTEQRSEYVVTVTGCPKLVQEMYGWFGSGASSKKLPNWVVNLPEAQKLELLYGYFSGDGHMALYGKENRLTARTASYDLATGIQRLLWSIGAFAVVSPVKSDGHYNCSVAAAALPERLWFGFSPDNLKGGSKTRGFVDQGRVYLPIRAIEVVEWDSWIYNIEVDQDHSYVSAGFYSHNCNRNGDAFSREDNRTAHRSFVDLGHVFKNHQNDDPFKAVGDVIRSAHHQQMSRIELLIGLDNDKCRREIQALENGEELPVSMGSMQDFDVCSICGHKAPTAADHCHHVRNMLGQILEDGRRVYMKNPNPKYFDISIVYKPADRIAYALRKVASASGQVLGGHDLAEMVGLTSWANPKYATLRALASMYKRVPAHLRKVTEPQALKEASVQELRKQAQIHGVEQLLGFLNANGWLLGPQDFGQVIGHPNPTACSQAVDDHGSLEDLMDDHTEIKALTPPAYQEHIPLSQDTQEDLEQSALMTDPGAHGRIIRITIVKPQTVKSAQALEQAEAQGFAALYGHYKLAFANAHSDRPEVLKNLASTF